MTNALHYILQIWEQHHGNKLEACKAFYREVVLRTARLVADWQCVGWCHGYGTLLPTWGQFLKKS